MSSIVNEIVTFVTNSKSATAACVLLSTLFVYFVLFEGNKKKSVNKPLDREIKQASRQVKVSDTSVDDVKTKDSDAIPEEKKASVHNDLTQGDAKIQNPTERSIQSKIAKVDGLQLSNDPPNEFIKQDPNEFVKVDQVVREPFLAEYDASTAMATLVAQEYVAHIPKAPRPFLAEFEASNAMNALVAQEYAANIKAPRPFLAEFEASNAINTLVAQEYAAKIKAPRPFLAEFEASNAINTLVAQEYAAKIKAPRPFLAEFEASNAINALVAQEYAANIKAPRPFLAEFEASNAINTLVAQEYAANIKTPRPFLAEFEASNAINALIAQEYAANIKTPKPFLAEFEASNAINALVAQEYAANIKTPKPFLAEFEASHAMNALIAQANIPKAPRPFLAEYNASTAMNELTAQKYVASLTTVQAVASTLVGFEATSALCLLEARQYMADLKATSKAEFVSVETTTAYQLLQQQQHESDGELTSSTSSTTSTQSENTREIHVNSKLVAEEKQFEPFTVDCIYYPNCTNKNCKFIHPGSDNNPKPLKRTNSTPLEPKRPWTRSERIERQSQAHYPVWKSRCVHWPYCTNNHCKYSHPIKECRMGEFCTFKSRCMFLHPSDFIEPLKKQPKQSNTNTPQLKRTKTLG